MTITLLLTASPLLNIRAQGSDSVDSVLIHPETPARFPGGYDSLQLYIAKNLIKPAKKDSGKVYIAFFVEKDGKLSDFTIIKGLTAECDQSAIDLVKKMPDWIPGKIYNKPVRQRMIIPIPFD